MKRLAATLAAICAGLAAPAAAETPLPITLITDPLAWEGEATVYLPDRELRIAVRTRIDPIGNVVSESWPLELGEAKGLRRMTLKDGTGTMERGGKKEPMPEDMYGEEVQQFEFYRHLQFAADEAPQMAALGVTTFQIGGAPLTWFRIDREGNLVGAVNEIHAAGGTAYQTFKFNGFLKSGEAIFPRHMEMTRDGKPYFALDVTRFDAR
jgi:hypothetical protein